MAAYRIDIILCVLLAQITNCQRQWETLIRHWRPRDAMVDVTNGFGIAIIQDYAYTRGNFAFSPYGAASVLVVLYEGSRGKTASQIQHALQLPWDCVITRIGFRDIHRHLRSYFLHEGYLSGVSMSKENVHLLPEFQDVLRFYGYSLESEMTTQSQTSAEVTLNTSSPATVTITTEEQTIDTKGTTDLSDLTTSVNVVPPSVTTSPNLQTITPTKFYESTDVSSDKIANNITTIAPEEFQTTITQQSGVVTETPTIFVNKEETEMVTNPTPITTQTSVTQGNGISVEATTTNEVGSTRFPQVTETLTTSNPKPGSSTEMVPPREESVSPEIQSTYSSVSTMTLANTESTDYTFKEPLTSEGDTTTTEAITTELGLATTEMLSEIPSTTVTAYATNEVTEAKMNNDDSIGNTEITSTIFTSLEMNDDLHFTGETATETTTKAENTDRERREVEGYRSAWQSTLVKIGNIARRQTCHMNPCYPFLIDGIQEEYVPVMSLTATFRFAYLRKLHATALEFPLDNDKYKLLLILPVDKCGLKGLIYSLSLYPLRLVYEALVLTRVNAVIPTFMADGDISLSTSLKKLGIWDIFDPKRANLTGMSDDPELYVRNIEQTIKVNIRNYMDPQNGELTAYGPIERFYATHPFLYFVLDKETHVTLILGKMTNPLSKKIN
ncbi:uncharacterized protein LOC126162411 isoform X1 [Schistocerca cancellata]|uniref:uncharacterized protein LOC126162411 isoform X1 n=3 Tax=Schistocerca cancellata TaxID=274614 RepID=UPI0021180BE9|nr:uncharacterized protein LOC126162411 isoform X1 [Schistocerca cancellata]